MSISLHWCLLVAAISRCHAGTPNISESFKSYKLVPDIISKPPKSILNVHFLDWFLQSREEKQHNLYFFFDRDFSIEDVTMQYNKSLIKVKFPSGAEVELGNELFMSEVASYDTPSVVWNAEDGLYTVMMIDPDAPTPADPFLRNFLHWLVINAKDGDVTSGYTVAPFMYPNPPPGDLHSFVFLIYRQKDRLQPKEFGDYATEDRFEFSPEDFAEKYHVGDPVAGNFFRTQQYDRKSDLL